MKQWLPKNAVRGFLVVDGVRVVKVSVVLGRLDLTKCWNLAFVVLTSRRVAVPANTKGYWCIPYLLL